MICINFNLPGDDLSGTAMVAPLSDLISSNKIHSIAWTDIAEVFFTYINMFYSVFLKLPKKMYMYLKRLSKKTLI